MITQEIYNKIKVGKPFVIMPDGQILPWHTNSFQYENAQIIPGSFNPLHDAHKYMYERLGEEASRYFELSISRYNKPTLSLPQLNLLVEQFAWKYPIILTNATSFDAKTLLLWKENIELWYHIGWDTYDRIARSTPQTLDYSHKHAFVIFPRIINGELHKYAGKYLACCGINDNKLDFADLASSNMKRII